MDMNLLGLITIALSLTGAFVVGAHAIFFHKSDKPIANKIRNVFITDCLLYCITFFFGLGAVMDFKSYEFAEFYLVRILIIALNIVAGIRLYQHYKEIKDGQE